MTLRGPFWKVGQLALGNLGDCFDARASLAALVGQRSWSSYAILFLFSHSINYFLEDDGASGRVAFQVQLWLSFALSDLWGLFQAVEQLALWKLG